MIKNEIKVLSDVEHIKKRSGMYIGSSANEAHERFLFGEYKSVQYVPGLVKLIDEIIDNSVDEAIRTSFKFANKIDVQIKGNSVTVTDNGRGIPQAMVTDQNGEQIPGPVAAWTIPKAGGNFGDDAERKTGGMNGVGSSLTNIFSVLFTGITSDGENEIKVTCSNGMENKGWTSKKSNYKGTSVSFTPDFEHFETNNLDEIYHDITLDRLQTLAVVYPDIQFSFNGKKVDGNFKKFSKQFGENVVIHETNNVSMAFATSPDGFRHLTYVNNIHTKNGGHHVECVFDDICEHLLPGIKKKYKGIEVSKARVKECLTMLMFIRDMSNMRFDSQTKERLTSPFGEIRNHIQIDAKKICQQILKEEGLIMPIVEAALARKLAAEAAEATKAAKKAAKAKVEKHIKAQGIGKVETTLFLTEGDSAMGPLINVRNQQAHGGYALRGKFINTWGMSANEILKNKEAFDICAITGLTIGEKPVDLQYTNIGIMTDADVDGVGSIFPSLLGFFSNWPELFEQGRIRFVKTPLVILEKPKKDPIWFYDMASYDPQRESLEAQGYKLRYIKGLGSLREEEYERVINDPVYDVVRLPENWKELFEVILGEDSSLRKEWMS
ncbi:topoisomerase II large subunit [Serratia phage 4S]|nr:topoisomerase II large subunit [Serratia phage 4S]